MNCLFISEKSLKCVPWKSHTQINLHGQPWIVCSSATVKMAPIASNASERRGAEEFLELLDTTLARQDAHWPCLEHYPDTGRTSNVMDEEIPGSVKIIIGRHPNASYPEVLIVSRLRSENNHFSRLESALGKKNFTFDCQIKLGTDKCKCEVFEKDICLRQYKPDALFNDQFVSAIACSVDFSPGDVEQWSKTPDQLQVSLTVTLKLNDNALNSIIVSSMSDLSSYTLSKLNLIDQSSMEGTIVVEGQEIKCHSSVLTAIFGNNITGTVLFKIFIPDMTEAAVRAVLAFYYHSDVSEVLKSSEIAYQLLVASENYRIGKLREFVWIVILVKERTWFLPEVLAKILAFTVGEIGEDGDEFYKLLWNKALAMIRMSSEEKEKLLLEVVSSKTLSHI